MRIVIALIFGLIMVTPSNAQSWFGGKKVKGNGKVVTKKRTTSSYDKIASSGSFDIKLVKGKEGQLVIEGEENIIKHIVTRVENGTLKIKTEKGFSLRPSWGKGVKITVPFKEIEGLLLAGSGDVVGEDTIETSNFDVHVSGSGDIAISLSAKNVEASVSGSGDLVLKGKTSNLDVAVSGSGEVSALKLAADNVNARVSGSGDVEMQCKRELKARISGSGEVHYKGNPEKVDTKVSGSGEVVKM